MCLSWKILFRFSSVAEEPEVFETYQNLFDELCERAEEEDDEEVLAFVEGVSFFTRRERCSALSS